MVGLERGDSRSSSVWRSVSSPMKQAVVKLVLFTSSVTMQRYEHTINCQVYLMVVDAQIASLNGPTASYTPYLSERYWMVPLMFRSE